MKQLHVTASLAKAHGGLPVFVTDLTRELARLGEAACLLAGGSPPGTPAVASGVPARVLAASRMGSWMREEHARQPWDLVHVHGLWARPGWEAGHFALREGLPLVVSPHGMLEPWALRHHAWRKQVARWLYQDRILHGAAALHVTSPEEARQVRLLGFRAPLFILPPGIQPPPAMPLDPAAAAAPKPRRTALFLSRLHPKKGMSLLLEAWHRVRPAGWELTVAGPDEGGHRDVLERQARELGLAEEVRFAGLLEHQARDTALRRADLLVLPTHSENFALVVPEALQYGVPVLTTRGTPWESLAVERCGWWVDVSVDAIAGALAKAVALDDSERAAMGGRGKALVERGFRWARLAPLFARCHAHLVSHGEPPPGQIWIGRDEPVPETLPASLHGGC